MQILFTTVGSMDDGMFEETYIISINLYILLLQMHETIATCKNKFSLNCYSRILYYVDHVTKVG